MGLTLTKGSVFTTEVEAAVVDEADVLVVGGGPAGVAAAIAPLGPARTRCWPSAAARSEA